MNTLIQSANIFKEGTKYRINFDTFYSIYNNQITKLVFYTETDKYLEKHNVNYYYLGTQTNNNNQKYYTFVKFDLSRYLYLFKYNNYEFYFNVITNDKGVSRNEKIDGQLEKKCHVYEIDEEPTEYILK